MVARTNSVDSASKLMPSRAVPANRLRKVADSHGEELVGRQEVEGLTFVHGRLAGHNSRMGSVGKKFNAQEPRSALPRPGHKATSYCTNTRPPRHVVLGLGYLLAPMQARNHACVHMKFTSTLHCKAHVCVERVRGGRLHTEPASRACTSSFPMQPFCSLKLT
ncbi:hypothetical protein Micbo1qcDRAFT_178667 [Microdochium bolleyi]|uniref:Uncharacterized protein n=1 Tax=Microdochium bolleyi TaxID=196109 RepID=A0A136ISU3_9PEZI|nr:hypothetical protein Micbo1qcDRAFT_178667 [Microdochium bolleyi]